MRRSLTAPWASIGAAAGLILLLAAGSGRAETCAAMVDTFNRLLDSGRSDDAEARIDGLQRDSSCSGYVIPAQRRLAAHRLAAAQKLEVAERPTEASIALVERADRPGVLWQASATLAEIRFGQRQFREAAQEFDQAIEIVQNETYTPKAPEEGEIRTLLARAAQARLLAANVAQGNAEAGFVETTRTRAGTLGGIYSPKVRGISFRAVPTPITFDYRSATLTPQGEQAALELARAIKEQRPERVTLIGHTDVRGGVEYNKKLSVTRAEAVAAFLRENDVGVPIAADGVGADEPLQLTPTTGLSQDDIYALNRRVEWRRD